MATANVQFSFTIEDQLGTKASMLIYSTNSDATTEAQLAAEWQALAGLVDLIVGGQILHGTASVMLTPSGDEKSSPATGSRVEQTGVFDFPVAATGKKYGVAVPSLADAVIVAGQIDLTDTNVQNFYEAIEGTYTASGAFTNNTYQDLGELVDAFISFRKRRKQLFRSSVDVSPE